MLPNALTAPPKVLGEPISAPILHRPVPQFSKSKFATVSWASACDVIQIDLERDLAALICTQALHSSKHCLTISKVATKDAIVICDFLKNHNRAYSISSLPRLIKYDAPPKGHLINPAPGTQTLWLSTKILSFLSDLSHLESRLYTTTNILGFWHTQIHKHLVRLLLERGHCINICGSRAAEAKVSLGNGWGLGLFCCSYTFFQENHSEEVKQPFWPWSTQIFLVEVFPLSSRCRKRPRP